MSQPETYFDLCKQNLELAREGRLADEAFCHPQQSSAGLALEWERDPMVAGLLAQIYYEAGHMCLAQRYAFEAGTNDDGSLNLQMLQLLVKTNIIYGWYPVAAKYIRELEHHSEYSAWATEQRRFLENDSAVDADPEYGMKRRCIPPDDFLATASGVGMQDLEYVIDANPEHRSSVEYLGVYYLLDCDFDNFRAFLDKYYGTPALPSLPRSFAEAVCMMSEAERGYWKRFDVDPAMYRRFCDFAKRLSTGLSMDRFKDTFWYYVMMMNTAL